jgi:protocatechuate 3,4-dioxygenase, beta subunit
MIQEETSLVAEHGGRNTTPRRKLIVPEVIMSRYVSFQRRRLLGWLALLSFAPMARGQQRLGPTPSQTEGPFYPRTLPAERDGDLTRVAGRSGVAQGTILYLSGTVVRTDGKPLAGALVELWQCDALGTYHHVGESGPQDENFQGYGSMTADAGGRYAFTTIRPVAYPGRTPHLHLKLRHPDAKPLTTQLYVAGDSTAGDSVVRWSGGDVHERLSMTLAPAGKEPGPMAATYDFVLASR